MTTTRSPDRTETPLTRELLYAARYYLGNRRVLLVLAGLALAAGLALNWSWLVAVGIAPFLLAALPCLAMCALGLCMSRARGTSCSTHASAREPTATAGDGAAPTIQAATLKVAPDDTAGELPSSAFAKPLAIPEPETLKERRTTDA